MNVVALTPWDLAAASVLIFALAGLSLQRLLSLAKPLLVAAARTVVQLSIVGFVLKALFATAGLGGQIELHSLPIRRPWVPHFLPDSARAMPEKCVRVETCSLLYNMRGLFATWGRTIAAARYGRNKNKRECKPPTHRRGERGREERRAVSGGWRTFRVRPVSQPLLRSEITCPASAEAGHRVRCIDCGLCDGTGPAKNIAILAHGSWAGQVFQERLL